MTHACREYDDNCFGCQPAMLDMTTGQRVPDTDPVMAAVKRAWARTPLAEKQRYHRVMVCNSRDPDDLAAVQAVVERVKEEGNN